jgi:predicted RNase H-like HicB family nuclease
MEFTAVIKKGDKQYVAFCPELDVVSQGYTVEESLKNLNLRQIDKGTLIEIIP